MREVVTKRPGRFESDFFTLRQNSICHTSEEKLKSAWSSYRCLFQVICTLHDADDVVPLREEGDPVVQS